MSLTWCHTMFFLFILSDLQTFSFRKIWSVPLAVPFPFIFCSFKPQLCWENIYRCPNVTTMLDWALKNQDTALLRRYMPWYKHCVWAFKTTCLSTLAAALRFCCVSWSCSECIVFCFLVLFRKHFSISSSCSESAVFSVSTSCSESAGCCFRQRIPEACTQHASLTRSPVCSARLTWPTPTWANFPSSRSASALWLFPSTCYG